VRDEVTAVIGERAYLALFSLASFATITWLAISYNAAQPSSSNRLLYDLGSGVKHLAIPAVALAFILGAQGLLMRSPTMVGYESAATKEETIRGVLRITRHPFLWGVVIWSAIHLSVNGDLASVIFFGTFLVLAFFGTFLIDAKRKRKFGATWESFNSRTSNIPFGAIIGGRNSLKLGETFGWQFWVAATLFLVILFAHGHLFHASPFPNGWVPF
jgi:uncharacterized membrane protein